MNILDLDFGNTSLKWRTIRNGERSETQRMAYASMHSLATHVARVDRVRVASVLKAPETQTYLQQLGFCAAEMARSELPVAGFFNGYDHPEKLGVDRWLAALAAKQDADCACLVIDCGTAITVDYISASGVFEGGYILAGKQLLQSSLLQDTSRVRFERAAVAQVWPAWPRQTAQAVQWGVDFIVMAVVEYAIQQAIAWQGSDNFAIYLTGGDGEAVATRLKNKVEYRPDLVLDGLAIALP